MPEARPQEVPHRFSSADRRYSGANKRTLKNVMNKVEKEYYDKLFKDNVHNLKKILVCNKGGY